MTHLRWINEDDYAELFVGSLPASVAHISRRKKWWDATIDLPGLRPRREFDTRENQIADIEAKVLRWFALAATEVEG